MKTTKDYHFSEKISFYYDSPNNQLAKSTCSCFSVWRAIQITKLSQTFKSKQFSGRLFFRDMLSSVVMRARKNEFESERGQKLAVLGAYSTLIWTQGPFLWKRGFRALGPYGDVPSFNCTVYESSLSLSWESTSLLLLIPAIIRPRSRLYFG